MPFMVDCGTNNCRVPYPAYGTAIENVNRAKIATTLRKCEVAWESRDACLGARLLYNIGAALASDSAAGKTSTLPWTRSRHLTHRAGNATRGALTYNIRQRPSILPGWPPIPHLSAPFRCSVPGQHGGRRLRRLHACIRASWPSNRCNFPLWERAVPCPPNRRRSTFSNKPLRAHSRRLGRWTNVNR